MKYTDIFLITLLYCAGVLLQIFLALPLILILILLPVLLIPGYFFKNPRYYFLAVLILGLFNAFLNQNRFFQRPVTDFLGQKEIISGTVYDHPSGKGDYTQCLLHVKKIGPRRVCGRIRLLMPRFRLEKGYRIIYRGVIRPSVGPANFGEIDYGLYEEHLGLDGTSFIGKKTNIIQAVPPVPTPFSRLILMIRTDLIRHFDSSYSPVQKDFLKAFLLGIRTDLGQRIKKIFVDTGTIHILAISGLHIGIIAFLCLTLFLSLGVSRRISFYLTLLFVILYNLIVGYQEPIMRSTIMFSLLILCYIFDRDRITLNLLALSGFIILLIQPLALLGVSFQLSFLATAGIIIFAPYLNGLIKTENRPLLFIRNSLSISLASQIMIIPVLLFHFNQFPYISFVANLVAVPLSTAILSLSALSYLFHFLIPPASLLLAQTSNFLIALLIRLLSVLSFFKPIVFENFNLLLLLIYLALVFLVFMNIFLKKRIFPDRRIRPFLISGLFVLALILIIPRSLPLSRNPACTIVFFNIRGRCVLIKTPENSHILLDSGSAEDMKKHILPFLARNRISQIDYLILSNYSEERSGGALLLLKTLPVGCFMDSGYASRIFRQERILEYLGEKKVPYRIIFSGIRFRAGSMDLLALNPPSSYFKSYSDREKEVSDNSLVLKGLYKGCSLLFCSDIRSRALGFLVSVHGKKLKATLINPPDFSSSCYAIADLLEACRPRFAVVNRNFSSWEKKDEAFCMRALSVYKIKAVRTQKKGSVQINLDPSLSLRTSRF